MKFLKEAAMFAACVVFAFLLLYWLVNCVFPQPSKEPVFSAEQMAQKRVAKPMAENRRNR